MDDSADAADVTGDDDDAKVIVRSNGTVTYVGKDIAYQLWKFGLLGRDFRYERFHTYADGRTLWATVSEWRRSGSARFRKCGDGVQRDRCAAGVSSECCGSGAAGAGICGAGRSLRFIFSYEIVALTPRCAAELGYTLSEEDARKSYVEVSGRKGLGVKADDLIDRLEAAASAEVDERHAELPADERLAIAHGIAIGALRYFLLKFTRTAIIAFDFEDALSFEN